MSEIFKRLLLMLLVFMVVLGLFLGGSFAYFVYKPLPQTQTAKEFSLREGSSLRSVSKQLVEAGILSEPERFTLLGKLLGKESKIKAGDYQVEQALTPLKLLEKITSGDYTQSEVRFIEGWTFKQMRAALNEATTLKHETSALTDQQIMLQISGTEQSPEGLFYPNTYFYNNGTSDITILKRAYRTMQLRLNKLWETRVSDLPLKTPYEALILASIVEKETGKADDRPLIAAVFINRLRAGMKLQTDPTIIYGLGDKFDGNLRKRDMLTDHPYNTYTRFGLPPTPIAMPGLASLTAVFSPAKTSALYFVAKGNGSSQFSNTLQQHNEAVTRYQRSKAR